MIDEKGRPRFSSADSNTSTSPETQGSSRRITGNISEQILNSSENDNGSKTEGKQNKKPIDPVTAKEVATVILREREESLEVKSKSRTPSIFRKKEKIHPKTTTSVH